MYYSVQQGFRSTRLSWFTVDEYIVDWSSEHIVYELTQPFPNHNGGKIVFDNQGYLYLGFGDGGSAADPRGNGQDLTNVYGTIIRLDVSQSSDDEPFRIPPDNPFIGDDEIPDEIWAYGLRNPWRMSFDPETDNLWIGDVGQSHREEINVVNTLTDAGVNFGWNRMEGNACFKPRKDCDMTGLTMPIEDYPPRSGNCSSRRRIRLPRHRNPNASPATTHTPTSAKATSAVIDAENTDRRNHNLQTNRTRKPRIRQPTNRLIRHRQQRRNLRPPLRRPHPQTSTQLR